MKFFSILALAATLSLVLISCSSTTTNTSTENKMETQPATTVMKDVAVIETNLGIITFEFYDEAPKHKANFVKLCTEKFYDGCAFHRVIDGFMIQGGDPNSKDMDRSNDGIGGPGYTVEAEINRKHSVGAVAAARQGDQVNPQRRSSGSQFYICDGDCSFLDNQYTVFGHVIEGQDIVKKIARVPRDARDNPNDRVVMQKVFIKQIPAK